jgi:hypothetical protein
LNLKVIARFRTTGRIVASFVATVEELVEVEAGVEVVDEEDEVVSLIESDFVVDEEVEEEEEGEGDPNDEDLD